MLLDFLDGLEGAGNEELPRRTLQLKALELLSKISANEPKGNTQPDDLKGALARARGNKEVDE